MYTPYLMVMTMFSGAGEFVDTEPYDTLAGCEAALVRMREEVERSREIHGILRTSGECREYDPSLWSREPGVRTMPPGALADAD